jgi:hypothetical protein
LEKRLHPCSARDRSQMAPRFRKKNLVPQPRRATWPISVELTPGFSVN